MERQSSAWSCVSSWVFIRFAFEWGHRSRPFYMSSVAATRPELQGMTMMASYRPWWNCASNRGVGVGATLWKWGPSGRA